MGHRRKLLVVDADAAAIRSAAVALRRRGYEVHAARDGSRALHLAILRSPDAILLARDAPLLDAPTLVRILRANPRTAAIPVLLTGDGALAPGDSAADVLRKPFLADELVARVEAALRRSDAGRAAATGSGFRGDLREVGLADVVQLLAANRRTGRLVVDEERGRAEIVLEDGRVTDAVFGSVTGEKALFRSLAARRGRFAFDASPAGARGGRIARRVDELLLEAARQADEAGTLAAAVPGDERVLVRGDAPALRSSGGDAPPPADAVREVRELLTTPRTLREVLDGASASDLEVLQAVATLLRTGELRPAPPASDPASGSAAASPVAVRALRARVQPGTPAGAVGIGKVLLAGGGPLARRTALARIRSLPGFAPSGDGDVVTFGTIGRLALAPDLAVDVVALPGDDSLGPVWRPFGAGALACVVLLPGAGLADRLAALAADGDVAFGICGPSEDALDAELRAVAVGWPFLGSDPAQAVRAVLEHAAARSREHEAA